jgi:peptidyl-prolyl cis-trans isomerase SurA
MMVYGVSIAQQATTSAQALFTVKGSGTSTEEFIYLFKKNHPAKEDYTAQKIDEYLNLFINFKLKVTEAKSRGIDTTTSFVKEYNSYKEELRKPYLPEGKIVDSLVRVTYARLQEEVRASHILINVKPDALPADTLVAFKKVMEIKQKALSGEDFAALASTYSEDPSARINKGDLGYFTALQMVFPFENAAYSGKKGDVVGPVRTRFGYHLLKIIDKRTARGEVEVSHIMIRTGERDQANAKNLIFELHDQLEGGVPWNEVCKQYSEDQSTKNTGGKLRPFGVGGMPVPEFEQAAFSLQKPGEISDPFQTQYGWHIVRLERKIPLPSFEESAATLKTKVSRDERVQLSKNALAKKLQAQFGYTPNSSTIDKVFALADTTLTQGKWKVSNMLIKKHFFHFSKQPIMREIF